MFRLPHSVTHKKPRKSPQKTLSVFIVKSYSIIYNKSRLHPEQVCSHALEQNHYHIFRAKGKKVLFHFIKILK